MTLWKKRLPAAFITAFAGIMAAFMATAPVPALAKTTAPAPDWAVKVVVTDTGSHLIGNPAAKIKVVEYVSYTCPHCAKYEQESAAPLKNGYVRQGTVSVEIRNLVRDPIDLSAALLANCGNPARFPANHHLFLSKQAQWIKTFETADANQKNRWNTGDAPDRLKAIAHDFGFFTMLKQAGYNEADLNRCIADQAMAVRLASQGDVAVKLGVKGTPSFLINNRLVADTHDWTKLEAAIKSAL